MSQNTFEIAFSGALAPGAALAGAKRNMAALFKTEVAKVEPLFSGKRFVIKKGLDQATALKYQRALHEAGLVVEVVDAAAAARKTLQDSLESAPATNRAADEGVRAGPDPTGSLAGVSIDPPGVILVAPAKVEPLAVDLSHLTLDVPGVLLVAPSDSPDLQVDLSGMTMGAPGVLLKEPEPAPELRVDTSALSLAEPGVTLVEPEEIAPAVIDTSRIGLA